MWFDRTATTSASVVDAARENGKVAEGLLQKAIQMIISCNNINRFIKFLLVLMLAGILGMLQAVKAEETYHINRTFTPVEFNLQGTPTVDQLFTESMKLTDTVRGDPIVIDSNGTYAIEQQTAIALGYDTAEAAWNAVLNYQGTPSN
ncbi:MAG: hypothetical protein KKC28_08460, partial [Verrucomicrobia bacterium]|nr:hypothetical protein [Verrucomicrobiota bacterium]